MNQKLIPQEAYPHSHEHHRSGSPGIPPIIPPRPFMSQRSSSLPPSPSSSFYCHDTNNANVNVNANVNANANANANANVQGNANSKNSSTRSSRSNSHSSITHSGDSSGRSSRTSRVEEMNAMNESINRLETRFGTLETCCAHILDKLDKVEQRHQEFQRDTRVVGQFTEAIAGFAKSIRPNCTPPATPTAGKLKGGWRSRSAQNLNTLTKETDTTAPQRSSRKTRR